MGVADVIRLEAGLSDDLVIAAIQKNGTRFDLRHLELIELKKAGVSDAVIKVTNSAGGQGSWTGVFWTCQSVYVFLQKLQTGRSTK